MWLTAVPSKELLLRSLPAPRTARRACERPDSREIRDDVGGAHRARTRARGALGARRRRVHREASASRRRPPSIVSPAGMRARAIATTPRAMAADAAGGTSALDLLIGTGVLFAVGSAGAPPSPSLSLPDAPRHPQPHPHPHSRPPAPRPSPQASARSPCSRPTPTRSSTRHPPLRKTPPTTPGFAGASPASCPSSPPSDSSPGSSRPWPKTRPPRTRTEATPPSPRRRRLHA